MAWGLTKPEKITLANACMDALKSIQIPTKTGTLINKLNHEGVHYGAEYNVRRTLERLRKAGNVERLGYSKGDIRYRLLAWSGWNRLLPFKPAIGATKPVHEVSGSGEDIDIDDDDSDLESEVEEDYPIDRSKIPTVKHEDNPMGLVKALLGRINRVEQENTRINNDLALIVKSMGQMKEELDSRPTGPRVIEIKKQYEGATIKFNIKDTLPKQFERVKQLVECRRNVLLVGPSGCGKSYLARKVAELMDLEFGSISCTAGMSESHFTGRAIPNLTDGKSHFQGTEWLDRYEGGGLMLLDEFDAVDPNLALVINTGLANGYMNVPNRVDKPRAKKHKDFVCVATANTNGRGATRMFTGRNQLDESTLDRFRIGQVEIDYDRDVERMLCPYDKIRDWCWGIRDKIEAVPGLRRFMSTRFLEEAAVMHREQGWGVKEIKEAFFFGWSAEERAKVE